MQSKQMITDALFSLMKVNSYEDTAGFSRVQDIYVSDFVASTISSILSIWIKNDFKESSIELADKAKIFFKGI